MKKLVLLLFLPLAALAYHSGPAPNDVNDQFGGKFHCPPNVCNDGGWNTMQHIKPKVLTYLGCDPGPPLCTLGTRPFVTAHVKILGRGGDDIHVRYHVHRNPDGSMILENWGVTPECSQPGVHAQIDFELD